MSFHTKKMSGPGHSSRNNSTFTLNENYIRREKRRRLENMKEIMQMRSELPEYDLNDIRMFKLPFHEALALQLEGYGYESTNEYLKRLYRLDERYKIEAGPHSVFFNQALLKHSDEDLRYLSDALMKAEDAHKQENYRKESEILLSLAIHFAFECPNYFWLAEELMLQCISIVASHGTTGKHEAICCYIYAKMLIEKVRDYEKAEQLLNKTRELSLGKSWNLKQFWQGAHNSDTLYMNANYLLHLCYLRHAKYLIKTDPLQSLEFATLAKKRATEACYHDGETEALYIKGQCELSLDRTKDAVSTFNKAFYIQSKLNSEKGMCEARVELSKAYLMFERHGSTKLALKTLLDLKAKAEECGFQFYLAQAYRYLGEYYLNCGEPQNATPFLSDALTIFYDTGNVAEADQVRNLGALSSGLELMPEYIRLLQRTDRRCPDWFENLIKLVHWKDFRKPFWPEIDEEAASKDILGRSIAVDSWSRAGGSGDTRPHLAEYFELSQIFEPKISSETNQVGPDESKHSIIPGPVNGDEQEGEEDETQTDIVYYD